MLNSLNVTQEQNYDYVFILAFIFVATISVICLAKYLGFTLSKDLADKLNSREDNLQIRLKKNFNYYVGRLQNIIIKFKESRKLYWISDLEEQRRNKILQRFYILTSSEKVTYKKFNAQQIIYFIATSIISVIVLLVTKYFLRIKILPIYFGILACAWVYLFIVKYLVIQGTINGQNYRLEDGFGDFFLSQYQILIHNHKKPLERGLLVFQKLSQNYDLLLFTRIGLFLIRTTSEEEAINELIDMYADVTNLSRLLVIEQQLIRGGDDSETELRGMRAAVLKEKENKIYEKCRQKEYEARIIVWAIMFIVIQVSIAALAYVVQQSGIFTG